MKGRARTLSWELRLPARPSRFNYYLGALARIVEAAPRVAFTLKRKRRKETGIDTMDGPWRLPRVPRSAVSTLRDPINATSLARFVIHDATAYLFTYIINRSRRFRRLSREREYREYRRALRRRLSHLAQINVTRNTNKGFFHVLCLYPRN